MADRFYRQTNEAFEQEMGGSLTRNRVNRPTLGDIVIYRAAPRDQDWPAIVIGMADPTAYEGAIVHLQVFSREGITLVESVPFKVVDRTPGSSWQRCSSWRPRVEG